MRMASLEDNRVEGEPMSFPHLHETFHSLEIEHDDIWPKQTTMIEGFGKLAINPIGDEEVKGEDIRALVCSHPLGYKPTNWSTTNILVVFSLSQ